MRGGKVILIKGSRSDREFCKELGDFLEDNEIDVIYRTASAHRTPSYLQKIIDEYSGIDTIAFITVAGLSDALSGATSANTEKLVIAYPPDLVKYGKAKKQYQ